jgi:hypothetical protein
LTGIPSMYEKSVNDEEHILVFAMSDTSI